MEEKISLRKSEVLVWFNKWISGMGKVFNVCHCLKQGDLEEASKPLFPCPQTREIFKEEKCWPYVFEDVAKGVLFLQFLLLLLTAGFILCREGPEWVLDTILSHL